MESFFEIWHRCTTATLGKARVKLDKNVQLNINIQLWPHKMSSDMNT